MDVFVVGDHGNFHLDSLRLPRRFIEDPDKIIQRGIGLGPVDMPNIDGDRLFAAFGGQGTACRQQEAE